MTSPLNAEYDSFDWVEYCLNQAMAATEQRNAMCDIWADRARYALDLMRTSPAAVKR
jgi:hypothetical protein